MKRSLTLSLLLGMSVFAADYSSVIEVPDAQKIIQKDLLPPLGVNKMPTECITTDSKAIARGAYIFHNLNGENAKGNAPEGLSKTVENGKPKQYGNCVACHNIEGAVGGGNIGPDLTNYTEMFVKTGVRDAQYVYAKIADPRVDNPHTDMTVNLTTKLFNEKEICELASYVLSKK
ncbi:Monoheme cytochrome SoxX [Sulfurimonas denitrificans DSM 1251]|uniref:Monoheme cytochrome SoxX n=1 Tax=Sulfurimonas denitrificans (strain ATCC 33889 / DSM 1251) TaxID=326298 RepID=Q30TZ0_SULDN|nr:sulfur oxidation c-type cytochrome SoxX [Sulfurimonas denitrificans]ABB43541.1 Monoheme cytochrome SoxX [Sulfurimonas denitrificans DSM 1251]MDD3443470.1 sulfur oxidation c-type cytochrome SoxX [Sulfurimonas denitrificans]